MHPGKSALHVAAAHGAAECAAALLRGGADAAAAAAGGLQPLHLAAASDHLAVVDTLLAGGAPCDALGGAELAPLHLAAGSGALRALSRLLQAGHPQLQSHALAAATLCPQSLQPHVSRLQPYFFNPGGCAPRAPRRHFGAYRAPPGVSSRPHSGRAAAAQRGRRRARCRRARLDPSPLGVQGAAVRRKCATDLVMPQLTIPAWWAALPPGSWLPYALRTSSGAAQGPMAGCGAAVRPGQSRQLCSCHTPRQAQRSAADAADAVAALLGARADPTARTRAGSTPLHLACEAGAAACAAALLTAGAEAGVANSDGVTPLHAAAAAGSEACLASLLGAGAPPGLQPHASGLQPRARRLQPPCIRPAASCAQAASPRVP